MTATQLRFCKATGQCTRLVTGSAFYCCGNCADAWEANPRFEPHTHTATCEQRAGERIGLIPGDWIDR